MNVYTTQKGEESSTEVRVWLCEAWRGKSTGLGTSLQVYVAVETDVSQIFMIPVGRRETDACLEIHDDTNRGACLDRNTSLLLQTVRYTQVQAAVVVMVVVMVVVVVVVDKHRGASLDRHTSLLPPIKDPASYTVDPYSLTERESFPRINIH